MISICICIRLRSPLTPPRRNRFVVLATVTARAIVDVNPKLKLLIMVVDDNQHRNIYITIVQLYHIVANHKTATRYYSGFKMIQSFVYVYA